MGLNEELERKKAKLARMNELLGVENDTPPPSGQPKDGDMLAALSKLMRNGLTQQQVEIPAQPTFDPKKYFSENMAADGTLSDEDVVMVSQKKDDGYKAAFVTLGELKKFIKS